MTNSTIFVLENASPADIADIALRHNGVAIKISGTQFSDAQKAEVQRSLSHTTDGPVTAFVLIARAMRLPPELRAAGADVLYDELTARGYLVDDE